MTTRNRFLTVKVKHYSEVESRWLFHLTETTDGETKITELVKVSGENLLTFRHLSNIIGQLCKKADVHPDNIDSVQIFVDYSELFQVLNRSY